MISGVHGLEKRNGGRGFINIDGERGEEGVVWRTRWVIFVICKSHMWTSGWPKVRYDRVCVNGCGFCPKCTKCEIIVILPAAGKKGKARYQPPRAFGSRQGFA